jgi:hypothetical protein
MMLCPPIAIGVSYGAIVLSFPMRAAKIKEKIVGAKSTRVIRSKQACFFVRQAIESFLSLALSGYQYYLL